MSVPRKIVTVAGNAAEWALADDGSLWLWTTTGWRPADRPPLPPRELPLDFYGKGQVEANAALEVSMRHLEGELAEAAAAANIPKRGPGRPRKQP